MSEIATSRDEFVAGLKNQIDRWNAEIERCEAQAGPKAGPEAARRIQSLRAQRDMALTKLRMLR